MRWEGKTRTSVRDGKSKTGKPYGRISGSDERLPGGKEEVSRDCVRGGGKLKENVSERTQVSETGSTRNRFWEEDHLKQKNGCQHERF
jgi:hypothetical protein